MKTRRHAKDDVTIFSRIRETRKKKGAGLGCYGVVVAKPVDGGGKKSKPFYFFAKVQKVRSLGVRFLSDMPLLVFGGGRLASTVCH